MYSVQSFIATAVTLPLLSISAVLLRFYVRLRVKFTYIGIDDWLIAFSCLLVCGIAADVIIGRGSTFFYTSIDVSSRYKNES